MDKKNGLLIGAAVLTAMLLMVISPLLGQMAQQDTAVITVDGREYARVPLMEGGTIVIPQENGAVNVVAVSEQGAVMQSSTCKNQLCVQMGAVNRDNWEKRPNGRFIICLPNRVSVEVVWAR